MQASTCYGHNMSTPKKVTELPEGTNPQLTHYIPVHDGTGLKKVLLSYIKTLMNAATTWGSITGTLSNQTDLQNALNAKQNSLGFTPENVANKKLSLADNSDTYYPSQKAVKTAVDTKQDTLVSGTNIKTINNTSLLGNGNISIESGITIDTTPITGGGSGRILFESPTGKVSESNSFKVDNGKFVFGTTSASAFVHFEDLTTNQTALLVNGYGGAYSGGLLPYIVDIRGRTGIGRFTIDSYGYVGFGTGAGNNYHTSNYKVDFGDGRVLMGNSLHLSTNTNDKRFQIVYGGYYAYMSNDRDVSVSLKLFADSGMRVTMFTNGNNFPSLIVFGNLVRQQYSNSVFQDVTVGSTGLVTYDAVGSGAKFKFMKPINLQNIPTSASGLSSGDVWNDSGTLKIV